MTTLETERNRALADWYRDNRRPLPWRRRSDDPYPVLVSELMLQQTQAERVAPYYQAFLDRFPTVESLAEAGFVDVAAAWSGLGYNRRAKSLHRAARIVAVEGWPSTVEGLEGLPGVGPYTARAIAAFALGQRVAAVDTNLRRVLSRWHGERLEGRALVAAAEVALGDDAAVWNQAVMDLGALVCRPRTPRCDACPVRSWCAGPEVYTPPRRQGRFEGSVRQLRGALVRRLVTGPASLDDLIRTVGFAPAATEDALEGLIEDGLVVEAQEDSFELAD